MAWFWITLNHSWIGAVQFEFVLIDPLHGMSREMLTLGLILIHTVHTVCKSTGSVVNTSKRSKSERKSEISK